MAFGNAMGKVSIERSRIGKRFFLGGAFGNAMGKVIRGKREREADVLPMINKTTLSTPT